MKESSLTNQQLLDENSRLTQKIQELESVGRALRASEKDLRESQRIAHVGSWRLNTATNQVVWSEELYKMYGFDPALPPPPFTEHMKLFSAESWVRLSMALANTMNTGVPYELELKIVRKDGSHGWLWVRGETEVDSKGNPIGLWGAAQDITERKQAEKKLRESEAKLSTLFDTMTEMVVLHEVIFGSDGKAINYRITDCNRAFTKITGIKSEDAVGKLASEVYKTEQPPYLEEFTGVGISGDPCEFPVFFAPMGKHFMISVVSPKKNQFATITTDITEIKKAEVALSAEKERLAVTLRSIGDGVITTDTQGKIVVMNKVAEELTGWLLSEARGKPLPAVFHIINEGTRLPCTNPAEKVLETGEIIELANHTLLVSRDGTERIIADSGAPIMDQDSELVGVVLVFRDITEKQKILDVLQRTDKLDSLGVLAGGIAHDFNNILAGIFGYIDLARESTTDKTISEYLDKSMTAFNRAKDLTQQLLTFSKGGTPKREISALGPLIRECSSFALSGSRVACDLAIDEDLWLANVDKNQIGQVIDNLVINAQQAMPMGGHISISAKNVALKEGDNHLLTAGMYIKLSIVDTGIGIPANLLKFIFDPFFTTKEKGHGLGLATCYAIVQKHDGCVDVESLMGKGTTVHVFLPASRQGIVQPDSRSRVSHQGSGRILIMDDEPYIREILGRFLKGMGYTTLAASDGEEALRLCAEAAKNSTPIDGAIFDLTIPGGMGGKEAIVHLRKLYPNMPVYASSGYSEDPVMARPTEYGFIDSICKPYRKDQLAAMLNRNPPGSAPGAALDIPIAKAS